MATITVSLAYADTDAQHYTEIQIPQGTTLHQAIGLAGWFELPSLATFGKWCDDNLTADPNHKAWYVGIYSQKKRLDTVLSDGDRVEIYRALSYDPMTRRKSKSVVRLKKLGYRPL